MAIGQASLASIGMSVPGATGNFGADLQNQSAAESDDDRRRRLEAERQSRLMGGGAGTSALASTYGVAGMSLGGRYGL